MNKFNTRLHLRKLRNNLSSYQQKKHAKSLLYQCQKLAIFRLPYSIALYYEFDGEIATNYLQEFLKKQGKKIYMPVIDKKVLKFVIQSKKISKNSFGIQEPKFVNPKHPKKLNLILTPLVGFDNNHNRLGMGGGFYDRTLAFSIKRKTNFSLKVHSLAHSLQHLDSIKPSTHDIKVKSIITEIGSF